MTKFTPSKEKVIVFAEHIASEASNQISIVLLIC